MDIVWAQKDPVIVFDHRRESIDESKVKHHQLPRTNYCDQSIRFYHELNVLFVKHVKLSWRFHMDLPQIVAFPRRIATGVAGGAASADLAGRVDLGGGPVCPERIS